MKIAIIMEIPKADIHNFISINPKNAEDILVSMSGQLALMSKHIEIMSDEK